MSDSKHDNIDGVDVEQIGEYTRIKAKVQLGDGVDQRSETTVEIVRSSENEERAFTDFALELERAVDFVRSEVGLNE